MAIRPTAKITSGADGQLCAVEVGGVDISNAVQAVTYRADAQTGEATAELKLVAVGIGPVSARPVLVEDDHRALVALGWTPPESPAG